MKVLPRQTRQLKTPIARCPKPRPANRWGPYRHYLSSLFRSVGFAALAFGLPVYGQAVGGELRAKHQRFVEAYAGGDQETALRLGEELVDQLPEPALLAYDLALLRAARGEPAAALTWLRKAATSGFSRPELLDAEAGFTDLRALPPFAAIRQRIADNRQAEIDAFHQRARNNPPRLVAPERLDPARPAPLIVALHGRGGLAEPIEQLWRPVAQRLGAVLATPQALTPYAQGFQWSSQEETTYQTLQAIEVAAERYAVDRDCVLLTGFSQGGRRSIATAFAHPDRFAGVVVIGSAMDSETAFPDLLGSELPRFFFMVGALDRVIDRTRATAASFTEQGIANQLAVYPNVGHSFPRDHRRQLRRAIRSVSDCAFGGS